MTQFCHSVVERGRNHDKENFLDELEDVKEAIKRAEWYIGPRVKKGRNGTFGLRGNNRTLMKECKKDL